MRRLWTNLRRDKPDALHGAANHQQVLGRLQGGDTGRHVERPLLSVRDARARSNTACSAGLEYMPCRYLN